MRQWQTPKWWKARVAAGAALCAAAALFALPGRLEAAQATASSGFAVHPWWGSGERGGQFLVPAEVEVRQGPFAAGLLTAYAHTWRRGSGGEDASLSALLDTKLTTSYSSVGRLPVDVLLGLDFNLPTGKTRLSPREASLVMDPDLVPITSFGEGFNVNPTLALARSWGAVAAGVGAGYAWRGSYDLGSAAGGDDYDPGDVVTLSAEVRWAFAPTWEARLAGGHARYGRDELDGKEVLGEGDFWSLLAGCSRDWGRWSASAQVQGIFRQKSEVLSEGGTLGTEPERSRGPEWRAAARAGYALDDATRLTAALEGLYVAENGYPEDSPFFVGSRERVALTAGVERRFASVWEARADLGGFYLHTEDSRLAPALDAGTYLGLVARALVTARF